MPSVDNHLTPNSFIQQLSGRAAIPGFTALAILPFSGKAFHVDDPFFIHAARHILDHPFNPDGNTIWFFGHWGFQHYMESYGAKAVDRTTTTLLLGDRIVVPENNSNLQIPDEVKKHLRLVEELTLPAFPLATTLNLQANAGFYSSVFGPLPFTFARSPAERYWVFTPVH